MTAPSPPAERETPAGLEAMREALDTPQWAEAVHLLEGCIHPPAGPAVSLYRDEARLILRAFAMLHDRLTAERDEAQAEWALQRDHNIATATSLREAEGSIADLMCDVRDRDAWLATLRTEHAADLARKEGEIARLRAAIYRFVNLQGSLIPRRVFTAASAALTNPEQTDA